MTLMYVLFLFRIPPLPSFSTPCLLFLQMVSQKYVSPLLYFPSSSFEKILLGALMGQCKLILEFATPKLAESFPNRGTSAVPLWGGGGENFRGARKLAYIGSYTPS